MRNIPFKNMPLMETFEVLGEADIDKFIKEQKMKLAQDRQELGQLDQKIAPHQLDEDDDDTGKNKWRKQQLDSLQQKQYEGREAQQRSSRNGYSSKKENVPPGPDSFLSKLGGYAETKRKLKEEQKIEYQKFLDKNPIIRKTQLDNNTNGATLPGLQERLSAQYEKKKKRNEEYNKFLVEKEEKERHRFDDKKPREILQDQSPQYNSDQPKHRRVGWASPYEEMLEEKRREEAYYRRYDDAEYQRPGVNTYNGNNMWHKTQIGSNNLTNDEPGEPTMAEELPNIDLLEQLHQWSMTKKYTQHDELDMGYRKPSPELGSSHYPTEKISRKATADSEPLYVGLQFGRELRESAKQRQKNQYRKELDQQIRDRQQSKLREKMESMKIQFPDDFPARKPQLDKYHSDLDTQLNLDYLGPSLGTQYHRSAQNSYRSEAGNLLEKAWTDLKDGSNLPARFDRPRLALVPPPDLEYKPSKFLDSQFGMSSVDKAYEYYGLRNPLDLPVTDDHQLSIDEATDRIFPDTKWNQAGRTQQMQASSVLPLGSNDHQAKKSHLVSQTYQAELNEQIKLKQLKKLKEKEEEERYNRKIEEEIKNYNPFGRGGGGAPLKDNKGNLITDLRHMHKENSDPFSSKSSPSPDHLLTRHPPPQQTTYSGEPTYARGGHGIFGQPKTYEEKSVADRYKEELERQIQQKRKQKQEEEEKRLLEEERENKRLEDQRRKIQLEYEEEVRQKKAKQEEAQKKDEENRRKVEERKKEMEKKKKEADEKRQKEMLDRLEQERIEKQNECNNTSESSCTQSVTTDKVVSSESPDKLRPKSPPVPALWHKMASENPESDLMPRQKSPLIPVLHQRNDQLTSVLSHTPRISDQMPRSTRAQSADVLNQLALLKQQLQNEKMNVEHELKSHRNEVDVSDPRQQRPPHGPSHRSGWGDAVFQAAMPGHPVKVRRAQTSSQAANLKNLKDFNELKYCNNTQSRTELRNMFPEPPLTSDALETQQRVLIRQQENSLRNLKKKQRDESSCPDLTFGDLDLQRQRTISPQPLLESKSAFIDSDAVPFGDSHASSRNESARQRRRLKSSFSIRNLPDNVSLASNPLGSTTSLNPDKISKTNEERLKKLQKMTDAVSLTEPEEILDRFMAGQNHNRPPSGLTLDNDAWLQPTS